MQEESDESSMTDENTVDYKVCEAYVWFILALHVCQSICPSIRLSVHLSICQSIYL